MFASGYSVPRKQEEGGETESVAQKNKRILEELNSSKLK